MNQKPGTTPFPPVEFVHAATGWNGLPNDARPEIAFIGRSNVGKSSLVNAIVGRKAIARVSRTPGKTQQFNFYLAGERFYVVDVPGFGYAKVSQKQRDVWAKFIERYVTEREVLRLVCHLVDSRHEPTALDRAIFEAMQGSRTPYSIVMTKADKLSGNGRAKSLHVLEGVLDSFRLQAPVFVTSAEDGRGIEPLRVAVLEAAGFLTDAEAPAPSS